MPTGNSLKMLIDSELSDFKRNGHQNKISQFEALAKKMNDKILLVHDFKHIKEFESNNLQTYIYFEAGHQKSRTITLRLLEAYSILSYNETSLNNTETVEIKHNHLPKLSSANKDYLKSIDPTFEDFLSDLDSLGIIGTTSKMTDTDVEPEEAMSACKKNLRFLGLCGEKWMNDTPNRKNKENFRSFLSKIAENNGKVKFLLIHPNCDAFKRMKRDRGEHFSPVNYPNLLDFVDEFSEAFEVHLYEFKPFARMLIIDDDLLAISNYNYSQEKYLKSNKGSDVPHLLFKKDTGLWSFFISFQTLFRYIWDSSVDIKDKNVRKYINEEIRPKVDELNRSKNA